jgi:molybdopterin-guanine dinucleotide biosynthesis protein A
MRVAILAGGQSQRMGMDKARMFNTVPRLQHMVDALGAGPALVLCGSADRQALFSGEIIADPPHCNGLLDVVRWLVNETNEGLLLLPCDAFAMEHGALAWLLNQSEGGVPVDPQGRRQPTMAVIPHGHRLPMNAASLMEFTASLPSLHNERWAPSFANYNRPEDLRNRNF